MAPKEMIARLRRSLKSDGTPILTHETAEIIGMLDRLEKCEAENVLLRAVVEATKRLRSGLEITNHHIRRDGTAEIRLANITDNQSVIEAMDALAALDLESK